MAIKLNWVNPNSSNVTIEIYRGDAPLDRNNLTNPVATLTNGETSWVDATAVFDRVYYYVFVTKRGTDRVVGGNNKVETTERKGAGPNNFLYGNDKLGYYGRLLASEFFSSNKIVAALKSLSGIPTAVVSPGWHKFARNGKTLYVPEQSFGLVQWNALYKAGAVYGVDGPGPEGGRGTLAAVNQKVTVELNGDEYLVRLPLGIKNKPEDVIDFSNLPKADDNIHSDMEASPYNALRCEFNDLFYPLFHVIPSQQRIPNVRNLSTQPILRYENYASDKYRGFLCQEHAAEADYVIARGRGWYSISGSPLPRISVSAIKLMPGTEGRVQPNQHVTMWMPVLELVTPVNVSL